VRSRQRRILLLAPFAPSGEAHHGGARALAGLLEGLAIRNRIALIHFRGPKDDSLDPHLRERCEQVVEVLPPRPTPPLRQLRSASGMFRGRPVWATKVRTAQFRNRVATLCAHWVPDIIQVEFSVMGQYLDALDGCTAPRVLTVHDPGAESAHERAASGSLPARAFHSIDAWAWDRFESAVINRVDAAVTFTDRDRAALLRRSPLARIVTIPLSYPVPRLPLDPTGCHPPRILFVGSFTHPPNVDAARRLIERIFPLVLAQVSDASLDLVGGGAVPHFSGARSERVRVTGPVPKVSPYLNDAAVVVVPLRLGGGMRVKVLEAMAAGKAVVASPLAVEGLDVTDGREFVLAESDGNFADAVVNLIQNPEARLELARGARTWAERKLTWDASVRAYEALYDSLEAKEKLFREECSEASTAFRIRE